MAYVLLAALIIVPLVIKSLVGAGFDAAWNGAKRTANKKSVDKHVQATSMGAAAGDKGLLMTPAVAKEGSSRWPSA